MERQITADAERRYFTRARPGRFFETIERRAPEIFIDREKKERKIRFKINLAAFYTAIVRKFKREPPFVSTDLENICDIIFDLSAGEGEEYPIPFGRVS